MGREKRFGQRSANEWANVAGGCNAKKNGAFNSNYIGE